MAFVGMCEKMNYQKQYDVIVIGGGHAGSEAALASARMGASTLLLTHNIETLGQMSCNPAIGGIGKSQLVKEVDALGGAMALAIDSAGIQFRILNSRKGPAVRATRAQADRNLYRQAMRSILENQNNLEIFQQSVIDLIVTNDQVNGVVTEMGLSFFAKSVVLTVGTFLGGKIHIGFSNFQGGRAGDPPSNALAQRLRALPFRVKRLKTGTPPRIDARTIDYSSLSIQHSDTPLPVFSYMGDASLHPRQIPCHITYTNEKTHRIIQDGLQRSPLFTGKIEGLGPRYCPSIEDKVVRFADKTSHQIFIEPEGLNTHEVYPNGISTSLPFDMQLDFVRSIKGFENSHITRPGYAIEYDFFDPRDLAPSLQTKYIEGLFFAGQINGTTGYEEAAAQGIIAGLNAALFVANKSPWTPKRSEAYIGVLIDDLITCGTLEPYRMFTSRAEYRLLLREDNADLRLTEKGYQLGLVDYKRWAAFDNKYQLVKDEKERLQKIWIQANSVDSELLYKLTQQKLTREYNAFELLKRPELNYKILTTLPSVGCINLPSNVIEQIEVQAKYDGYIHRQLAEIERQSKNENTLLPNDIDYDQVKSLSTEAQQKLKEIRPTTIGMAARIPGITPASISLLLIHLKKMKNKELATSE